MSFMSDIGGTALSGDALLASASFANALAEELVIASRLLGDLAYDLGSDEATLRRHMTSIQAIDRITQMQLAIADLLRARRFDADALAALPLQEMVDRLMNVLTAAAPGDTAAA